MLDDLAVLPSRRTCFALATRGYEFKRAKGAFKEERCQRHAGITVSQRSAVRRLEFFRLPESRGRRRPHRWQQRHGHASAADDSSKLTSLHSVRVALLGNMLHSRRIGLLRAVCRNIDRHVPPLTCPAHTCKSQTLPTHPLLELPEASLRRTSAIGQSQRPFGGRCRCLL